MAQSRLSARPERTRPPRALVVVEPSADEAGERVDWSPWYLTDEEDMPQAPDRNEAMRVFTESLRELFRERGATGERVGFDEFFAWVREEPLVRVSPDVFVHPDPGPPYPESWQTWHPRILPPRFALEIVSQDWRKDYEINPAKYWQLGTRELVVFDVDPLRAGERGKRIPLQVFRRDAEGVLVRVHAGRGPERSEELDAWLVIVEGPTCPLLRLARDPEGRDLVPTGFEARAAAEKASEAAQAKAERIAAKLRELGIDPDLLE